MLRLSRAQTRVFTAEATRQFELRSVRQLRRHFPAFTAWSDAAMLELVREGVRRAEEYGIDNDHDIALFLGAIAELGRDFDRNGAYPRTVEILRNPYMDSRTKVVSIYMHMEPEMALNAEVEYV